MGGYGDLYVLDVMKIMLEFSNFSHFHVIFVLIYDFSNFFHLHVIFVSIYDLKHSFNSHLPLI